VIDGWRYFGYRPGEGQTDADMGRHHAEIFLDLLRGEGFASPNPQPIFPNPPGLLRLEPHFDGLRERIWWGTGSNATAIWAAKLGMNLPGGTMDACRNIVSRAKTKRTLRPLHFFRIPSGKASDRQSCWDQVGAPGQNFQIISIS
jgi:alkanesulfonate monooxygenase SsuD/methylene tetrahydromethanopterin reductase-like flavin-dependent oxidoreductase (luciferase family)